MMKVFKMDDYDWVAAETLEAAIDFYLKETGVDKEDLDVKPINNLKNEGMYCEITLDDGITLLNQLANEHQVNARRRLQFAYVDIGLAVWKPFEEVLKEDPRTEPYIICSTEC